MYECKEDKPPNRKVTELEPDNPPRTSRTCTVGLENLAQVSGMINGRPGLITIDSGAQSDLISKKMFERLKRDNLERSKCDLVLLDVQERQIKTYGQIKVKIQIGSSKVKNKFIVVDHLPSDCLLGRPFLKRFQVEVCHGTEQMRFGSKQEIIPFVPLLGGDARALSVTLTKNTVIPAQSFIRVKMITDRPTEPKKVYESRLPQTNNGLLCLRELLIPEEKKLTVLIANTTKRPIQLRKERFSGMIKPVDVHKDYEVYDEKKKTSRVSSVKVQERREEMFANETAEDIEAVIDRIKIGTKDETVRGRVKELLRKYHKLFSRHKWDIGRVSIPGFSHSVPLKEDAVPKRFPAYRVGQLERKIVEKFVEKMKNADLIKESKSPWAMPLMLIAKGDDPSERRPVVNCRYLNLQQHCEATYLPRAEDLLDRFTASKKFISKCDLTQWYFQIPLDEMSKDVCSFSTAIGNFSSEVLLQGDANAVGCAQKLQMRILEGIADCFALIDDIAVASETLEEHLKSLEEMFRRMLEIGVTLRPDKLELLSDELEFLGFKVKKGGQLKITDDKVSVVRSWPRCQTISEVKSFLGFCSYVRKFVKGFSQIAKPLLDLAKKARMAKEDWTPAVERAFSELKEAITTAPCLIIPDVEKGEMHLYCDASKSSLAYVLAQELEEDGRKVKRPCSYGSRLFRGSEQRYSIPEKECLGAVWAIKKNRPYLYGKVFNLHTDSEGVYHTLRRASPDPLSSRLSRFKFDVLEYSFHCWHVRTDKNWADALSRLPVIENPDSGELEYRVDEIVQKDPQPTSVNVENLEIDPLWISAVTRGQALDAQVGPGLREEQKKDPQIAELRKLVQKTTNKVLKKGRFAYQIADGLLVAQDKSRRKRIVVPKSMVQDVLIRAHGIGHLGAEKMYKDLSKTMYWLNQYQDISEFVKNCFVCQTCKTNYKHVTVPLRDLPRPKGPQDVLALDVKGPIAPSRGKQYIIVCVDVYTRFAWTKCVGHVDGKAVIDFLLEKVFPFGVCNVLVTDNAKNLTEGVAGYMYSKMGVVNRNSLPLFASSNGSIERLIGTIASMLRCAYEDEPTAWPDLIGPITSKYNQSVHRATKQKPFTLHCGYEARELGELPPVEDDRPFRPPERYLNDQRIRREKMNKAVHDGLHKYYRDMKEDYDSANKVQAHGYSVGDWVLVRKISQDPGDTKALGPLYYGPAEIVSVSDSAATVEFLVNGVKRLRSVTQLKPYYGERAGPVLDKFTGPKRGVPDEMVRGLSQDSPLLMDDQEDDDEVEQEKSVTFAADTKPN